MKWIVIFFIFLIPLSAAQKENFDVLQESVVHEGDYFTSGKIVEISGIVKGDVFAFGSQILVDGIVEGDVIAVGGNIEITGVVNGNARLAGGQIEIYGTIGKNVTTASGDFELGPNAVIKGNAILNAGMLDVSGTIRGNSILTASTSRILGNIGGKVKSYSGSLRIGSRASIAGRLEYSSSEKAEIDPRADVKGKVIYHQTALGKIIRGDWRQGIIIGSRYAGALMNLIYSFIVGWIFIAFFPKRLKATLAVLDKSFWKAFWMGFLIVFLLPVIFIILMITVLGFPLALAVLSISLLGFYTAKIFPIIWLCSKISAYRRINLWIFFFGLLVFILASQIPFFGEILRVVITFMGLGALWMGKIPKKRSS